MSLLHPDCGIERKQHQHQTDCVTDENDGEAHGACLVNQKRLSKCGRVDNTAVIVRVIADLQKQIGAAGSFEGGHPCLCPCFISIQIGIADGEDIFSIDEQPVGRKDFRQLQSVDGSLLREEQMKHIGTATIWSIRLAGRVETGIFPDVCIDHIAFWTSVCKIVRCQKNIRIKGPAIDQVEQFIQVLF